jgi:predicted oxidoreductase
MDDALSESEIVRVVAEKVTKRATRTVIGFLHRMIDKMSGEDSGLKTIWDEVCVQVQDEESVFWDIYDEIVREFVRGTVAEMSKHEREAIWLQTEAGIDWSFEEQQHREAYPIVEDNIIDYLVRRVYSAAADWSNARIDEYMSRSRERD